LPSVSAGARPEGLNDMSKAKVLAKAKPEVEDPFLTVEEAAAFLNQTPRWVRRQVEEENIRYAKLGRGLRFRQSWLEEYVAAHTSDGRERR